MLKLLEPYLYETLKELDEIELQEPKKVGNIFLNFHFFNRNLKLSIENFNNYCNFCEFKKTNKIECTKLCDKLKK